jgi:hypothetical protein
MNLVLLSPATSCFRKQDAISVCAVVVAPVAVWRVIRTAKAVETTATDKRTSRVVEVLSAGDTWATKVADGSSAKAARVTSHVTPAKAAHVGAAEATHVSTAKASAAMATTTATASLCT